MNGKGIKCSLGFSTAVYTYDNLGNRISECYFDIEGKPTCSREGYYKIQRTYDDAWNPVSTQQWRLVPGMNLKEEKTLDNHSRAISVKYYSMDETPVINSNGYHEKRNSYDSTNGHLLWKKFPCSRPRNTGQTEHPLEIVPPGHWYSSAIWQIWCWGLGRESGRTGVLCLGNAAPLYGEKSTLSVVFQERRPSILGKSDSV